MKESEVKEESSYEKEEADENPFYSDLEPNNNDLYNSNNDLKGDGKEFICFFEKQKEVRQCIKELHELYYKVDKIIESLIKKHKELKDLYNINKKYENKAKEIIKIIEKIKESKKNINCNEILLSSLGESFEINNIENNNHINNNIEKNNNINNI